MSDKKVPNGTWLYVRPLPADTTDAEVANHFCECGLAIPEENVVVKKCDGFATAVVSVPEEEITLLIGWAVVQKGFRGGDQLLNVARFSTKSGSRYPVENL